MTKELRLDPNLRNIVDSYIVVGDTIGDKTITEIWVASTGNVMFTIIGIRERTLYRLRQSGVLQKGKHYRLKNPLNPKSHILYDVAAVIEELTRADLEKTLIETDKLADKKKKISKKVAAA